METEKKKTLAQKLAEVQLIVDRIPKRGRNDFHGYNYATESDIVETVRKELASRGVVLLPSIVEERREPVGEKGSYLTTLKMEFTWVDAETGEERTRPWVGWGSDKDDKGGYKATTGGEKYFILKSFMIPTGDDPERETERRDDIPGRYKGRAPRVQAPQGGGPPQGGNDEPPFGYEEPKGAKAGAGDTAPTQPQLPAPASKSVDVVKAPVLDEPKEITELRETYIKKSTALADLLDYGHDERIKEMSGLLQKHLGTTDMKKARKGAPVAWKDIQEELKKRCRDKGVDPEQALRERAERMAKA